MTDECWQQRALHIIGHFIILSHQHNLAGMDTKYQVAQAEMRLQVNYVLRLSSPSLS